MRIAIIAALLGLAASAAAQSMRPGATFRDCAGCPELSAVPAGEFVMGTPPAEAGRGANEGPQHRVAIRAFALGRTHVTRGEFAEFVHVTGHQMPANCYARTLVSFRNPRAAHERTWRNPGFAQDDTHPVVCVSWADAQAYLRWLSTRGGRTYRLPSEAEWEYAARAGTTTARWWGEATDGACDHANASDLTAGEVTNPNHSPNEAFDCRDGHVHTAPVASFPANLFGLHDMLGNAWQWVADCVNRSYVGAPEDGSAWTAGDCQQRVLRGGGWDNGPRSIRAGNRAWEHAAERSDNFGFRVARELGP
ncbi:MAG: formylglycine-generating enzyme family protein [Proteobacteria bacterium]|nr:formylglycine-generating enzyme family protein [Pseudomonadota bacterium]